MSYHKSCEEIESAWEVASPKWSAEVKSRYFNWVYLPLLSEAEKMYQRNENLEEYAQDCLQSLCI